MCKKGFNGFQMFVASIKSRCKLIGFRPVTTYNTILSNVTVHTIRQKKLKIKKTNEIY